MAKLKTLRQMINRRDLEIVPSRRFRVQPMWRLAFALLFQALFLSGTGWSQPDSPESIRIQLKWKHQFQFAGYYAAIEKGFYAESGLKVELIEREPGTNFVESVLSGHADYGIGDVGLLINRCEGDPIVILAQIFQHSPLAFASLRDSGIISPYEMIGKRAMCDLNGKNHAALAGMVLNTIGDLNQIEYVPQSLSLDALLEGNVDVCSVYTTNEPFELREKGIDFTLITPQSYGVDYYGDNFFTTENEIREHPDRVRKVIDATLKGWKYAIENPDEVIDTIIEKYSPGSKREKLAYEAKETLKLIAPELTPLGEINPSRFRTFAQQMATMGVVEEGKVPPGFIFPARLQPAIPLSNEQLEWLEGHPDVSLGFASNFEPLFWLDDQGRQQGVLSDMLDLLNQRLGTRIEVVTADWGDTVDSASMGELDGLLAIPEEMVGQLGMRGTHSYLSLLPTVFAKEGTVNKLKTLSDLRGKKVAVLARVDSLNRLLDPLEGDVEILKGGTARDCLEMVFQGKADATIGFPFYDEAIVRHFFTDIAPAFIFWDKPIQAVIGVRSDWPELVEILNLGIDSITSEKRNQIISKWSSRISEEQVELPRRESEWLARHPVIPVLVPKSSSPFIYTDSEGRERGIYVDFLTALGKRLGVRIQTRSVAFKEYSEEIFEKQSAILAVGPKSEIGEVEGYEWSIPVGYSHTAVFSKTGERRLSMNDLGDRIIGYSSSVSNDTPGFERFLKAKQTIGIDNPDEAISKLLSGEIDGYFDYYPVFNHQLKKAMVSDIEAVYVHPTPISANLLVKDDQGPLLSSVNRAIEAMENEEIPRLLTKWRFTEPAQENKRVHFSVKEDE
ncbi:MAG: ABC transporter substrate-binding protein [Candidatus Omnitrophica bacterium]|nr:ABC transporter substrate-binding protein [Candidatus Omnitrophota bacterium]